ncbi:hypothetical protein ACFWA9_22335 [Kitasatospora sp. NPDC059973]|uniref:hypothetical protein n=1 Tax=Kitasatospora sp. NPDC059973 TaxID=3347020 RepID=UPI0036B2B994
MHIVLADLAIPADGPSAEEVRDGLLRCAEPGHGLRHVYAEPRDGAVRAALFLSRALVREAEEAARELCLAYCSGLRGGHLVRVGATLVPQFGEVLLSGGPDAEG